MLQQDWAPQGDRPPLRSLRCSGSDFGGRNQRSRLFSLELLRQQGLGCRREPAYLHHLLSIPTLRTTFATWGNCQQLAVVAIFLDRTLILKTHEWGGGVQKQKCRDQAGSDFEYLLTIRNRNCVERNGSPWRKAIWGALKILSASTAVQAPGQQGTTLRPCPPPPQHMRRQLLHSIAHAQTACSLRGQP